MHRSVIHSVYHTKSNTTDFNLVNNRKGFFEQYVRMIMDHMILKTGVIMLK